jgi:hypothetical protein
LRRVHAQALYRRKTHHRLMGLQCRSGA